MTGRHEPWPELPWRDWEPTISTLHMWVQIVGKVRLALAPPLNHLWQVPLYVSARGLTTSPIPYGDTEFQVDFDFVDHALRVTDGNPGSFALALEPRSVARFYREFMAGLQGRGIDVSIWPHPVEVADAIPFDEDDRHASYDPHHAELLWRALIHVDRVMKVFQTGFVGKASPIHFFWGGFDLATTRYSGQPAPRHPGGVANCPDWVMQEAESSRTSRPAGGPAVRRRVPRSTPTPTLSLMAFRLQPSDQPVRISTLAPASSCCRTTSSVRPMTPTELCWNSSSRPTRRAPTSAAGIVAPSSPPSCRRFPRDGHGAWTGEPGHRPGSAR